MEKICYLILPHPGINAVFFGASQALSLAELSLCLRRLATPCSEPREERRAGLRWYAFDAGAPLPPEDIAIVSRLSSLYALFASSGEALLPVETARAGAFDEDLSVILKYTGKTNAHFTRLMLHIAELSLAGQPSRPIRMLDPVAGKGTTLFEGLMRGWEVAGIEIVQRAVHDAAVYFQKYLETGKWRHTLHKERVYGATSWRFLFARDKEALKVSPGRLTMIAADAKHADQYYGKAAFDILCGDLPYGVAHGNIAGSAPMRSPAALLAACLPAWRTALTSGGVLALSWNVLVYPVEDMIARLEASGFTCLRSAPYDTLRHRVDASIERDIIVAVKKTK